MSQDCRQSLLKALLNTSGMCHKTYTMTTRYRIYDMEDLPATQDSAPLDLAQLDHTMPEGDNESSDDYSEETDTCHPLAELLEQFQQLQPICLLEICHQPPTSAAELMQLTDKLQHLTMTLQPYLTLQPNEEQVPKPMQTYMDTIHITQREPNLTMTMLQDIPTFNGKYSLKLEDCFLNIESTTDVLT